ncbi:MAG TPA: hypothetical protein VG963_27445, partial [Polyangiaceae bacterium]|nr:hypothetical protein [Polyangiaceae bacterium]
MAPPDDAPRRLEFAASGGTSQSTRTTPALDPARFPVDGRGLSDLLERARKQGRQLVYVDPSDQPAGSFSEFVGADLSLDDVIAFMADPTRFSPETSPALYRPHFTLFLVFLRLFERARGELNKLTERHLDFYYREFLRMRPQGPRPDRVHVLFTLAATSATCEVPAATWLSAGKDSLGRDLFYRTREALIVRRARVEQVRAVFLGRGQGDAANQPRTLCALELIGPPKWKEVYWRCPTTGKRAGSQDVPSAAMFGEALRGAAPVVGWAARSEALALGTGTERAITLKLTLQELPAPGPKDEISALFADALIAEVSTVERFAAPSSTKFSITRRAKEPTCGELSIELRCAASFPSIAAIGAEPKGLAGKYPALRVMVKAQKYDALKGVQIEQVTLEKPSGKLECFHVHPFGHAAIATSTQSSLLPLLENEGELYLGLRDVTAPEALSLLVLADAPGPVPQHENSVEYSYLNGETWDHLPVRSDTTVGLMAQEGILQLDLPVASSESTRMPDGLYWIRATVKENTSAWGNLIALHTQAVVATFADQQNAEDHYERPLPSRSISQLAKPLAEVARVEQPYPSRGAFPAEGAKQFNTRVSERLRHKGRALSMSDYERLVLQQFPEIYKVKCVPAKAPGEVKLVVIPSVHHRSVSSRYQPAAPPDLLLAIRDYVSARAPGAAEIQVQNANYEVVSVYATARFKTPFNSSHETLATEALRRLLTPWVYEDSADITFGGAIYTTTVVNCLQHLPFV